MQVKEVDSETVADIFLGRAGLISGPGITVHPDLYGSIAKKLELTSHVSIRSLKSLGLQLRATGGNEAESRERVRDTYSEESPSPYLGSIAKPNWKVILSLALDSFLDDRIQIEIDKKPARKPLARINDLTCQVPPPKHTIVQAFRLTKLRFLLPIRG